MSARQELLGGRVTLWRGDCLAVLDALPENSVDSIVCDPPYHLTSIVKRFGKGDAAPAQFGTDGAYARAARGFMGKEWDGGDIAFRPETWAKALRVLKPGGHMVAFSGTRTYHRMATAIEDAGFEIRDMVGWLYGSGFPKSHDVSKAIDKAAGAERAVVGERKKVQSFGAPGNLVYGAGPDKGGAQLVTLPATEAAREWAGFGTALKPAQEPICLARKPLSEQSVAANVLKWRTGALNIDAGRVATSDKLGGGGEHAHSAGKFNHEGWRRPWMRDPSALEASAARARANVERSETLGRWPANIAHDGSDEVLAAFPSVSAGNGGLKSSSVSLGGASGCIYGAGGSVTTVRHQTEAGSAARFFYCGKAAAEDRAGSRHPTVKPVKLMRWLCRMLTPPGGVVLDPFAGSGTTGQAAWLEGFNAILIEREAEYADDIVRRMDLLSAGSVRKAAILRRSEPDEALPLFGGAP